MMQHNVVINEAAACVILLKLVLFERSFKSLPIFKGMASKITDHISTVAKGRELKILQGRRNQFHFVLLIRQSSGCQKVNPLSLYRHFHIESHNHVYSSFILSGR